jgi:acyl-CoA thioesterase-2
LALGYSHDEESLAWPPVRRPAYQTEWLKTKARLTPNDTLFHQCVITYWTDWGILRSAVQPHGIAWGGVGIFTTSLNHTIWYHQPFRADEYILFQLESPSAGQSRCLTMSKYVFQLMLLLINYYHVTVVLC